MSPSTAVAETVDITESRAALRELPRRLQAQDFIPFDAKQAKIGQQLFYDKILSGNKNISCGTCHHHDHASGDGLSLGIGEGGNGVGNERMPGEGDSRIVRRIPRNAPALWNLGAKQINVLFHDGRLSESDDYNNKFNSPAQEWLPTGFNSILAAQAMFPVTSRFEMAGDPEENKVARAAFDRIDHVWPILAKRVSGIPAYANQFIDAFANVNAPGDITMVEIANALAAFIGSEWQSFDSPFDQYLAGNAQALNEAQEKGIALFYGKGQCDSCHSGNLFSDQQFHALALPTFGPGRTRLHDPIVRDAGFMGESDKLEDAYRFRTPSLRNAELTAPYGHNGAYPTLEGIIAHHVAPLAALDAWARESAQLPKVTWLEASDFIITLDKREMQRYRRFVDIDLPSLNQDEIDQLSAFVKALTGESALTRPLGRPERVPSGLLVD